MLTTEDAECEPPSWAQAWVSERYKDGDNDFRGVPETHWRLAVLFCDVLHKAAGGDEYSRRQIFIVPRAHVSGPNEPRLAVCYEGLGELAEDIQLGHRHVEGFHYSLQFHDGDCFLECINHWSTAICG